MEIKKVFGEGSGDEFRALRKGWRDVTLKVTSTP